MKKNTTRKNERELPDGQTPDAGEAKDQDGMSSASPSSAEQRPGRLRRHLAAAWKVYVLFLITWLIGSFFIVMRPSFSLKLKDEDVVRRGESRAEFDFKYQDSEEIQAMVDLMVRQTPPAYFCDLTRVEANSNDCREWLDAYRKNHSDDEENPLAAPPTAALVADRVLEISHNGLIREKLKYLPTSEMNQEPLVLYFRPGEVPSENSNSGKEQTPDVLGERYRRLFSDFLTPEEARRRLVDELKTQIGLDEDQTMALDKCLAECLKETILFDEGHDAQQRLLARQRASSEVDWHTLKAGEPLISVTQRLGRKERDKYYEELRMRNQRQGIVANLRGFLHSRDKMVAVALLAMFCVCFGYCLYILPNRVASPMRTLVICSATMNLYTIVTYLISSFVYTRCQDNPIMLVIGCLPVALPSAIIGNLVSRRHAIVIALVTALTAPLLVDFGLYEYQLVHFSLFCGVISALMVYKAKYRRDFFKAAFWLGTAVWMSCLIFFWERTEKVEVQLFFRTMLFAYVNGAVVSLVCYLLIAVFEKVFSLVSPITLMELRGYNHKLLKDMMKRAGGTMQHTNQVAQLAEQGALAIGADADLTWAMAIFHDVGKLYAPQYFAENLTAGAGNPFDTLSPRESADIIRQHVTRGMEMALATHVNRPIRPVIEQHHGNSLIGNFHARAMQAYEKELAAYNANPQAPGAVRPEPPDEQDFRYHSPRPRQKEIVIVMLADACEAAVKSLFNRQLDVEKADAILPMIDSIFAGKLNDGQLDDSEITVHELRVLRDSFYHTFASIYHSRPSYSLKQYK